MSDFDAVAVKKQDHYLFKKADDFFDDLDRDSKNSEQTLHQPRTIGYDKDDQVIVNLSSGKRAPNPVCSHGRIFRFDDGSLLLVQFLRARVWRIRFNPKNTDGEDFTDFNTRTLRENTLSELTSKLDALQNMDWRVELVEDPQYLILQSVIDPEKSTRQVVVQLWIQREPFKIIAVRTVDSLPPAERLPTIQDAAEVSIAEKLKFNTKPGVVQAIVWQTKDYGLQYYDNGAVILNIAKPVTADHMGFGEQGGKSLFKKRTYLNYFNYDNMKYQCVYEKGPTDPREPLYHSEPYWIEVDALPGYKSQTGNFVDNYSHVCVDLGVKDPTSLRIATRFNSFQYIVCAGNDVKEVIQLYTWIIGRPRLKPRYVLGHHQGCYGYDTRGMVEYAVDQYRSNGIPLDGMHIDVDMQDEYRTFTIDTRTFPNPQEMFSGLRRKGVKCSTNITPYISSTLKQSDGVTPYRAYSEMAANKYWVKDNRLLDERLGSTIEEKADRQRYQQFGFMDSRGNPYYNNPSLKPADGVQDDYDFKAVYNSGDAFHGGVYYGWGNGRPGVYPNLNDRVVRDWWGQQYKYLFEQGLEFVWQDMTSPCVAEQYGDMKSLPFRLLIDKDSRKNENTDGIEQVPAIEIWSLYSYNLHKATYHGLNHLWEEKKEDGTVVENNKLTFRKNRRNFIIGRGSFAGMHRFAGLWTGDNASTWDFLSISVSQVLALGLSGVTISGADVGGFEFMESERNFASPELLVRWYCAYSLLPWFRNHYTKYRDYLPGNPQGKTGMRKDGKWFQEPFEYEKHYNENRSKYTGYEGALYRSVLPTCRYFIRLRYSLMQLMYDAMFENMITGLPIARAMCITDDLDRSLFSEDNQEFTGSQYLVRNDLLVAPALIPQAERPTRKLYLPYPDTWFPMNLRPDDSPEEPYGKPLDAKVSGGTHIEYDCTISDDYNKIPYTTPMYIRGGAIIPKIQVRNYVADPVTGDESDPEKGPNPITLHIYPGKDNTYDMYLDDGISRDSAPGNDYFQAAGPHSQWNLYADYLHDADAKSKFTQVTISQQTTKTADDDETTMLKTRTITVSTPWDKFGNDNLAKSIGTELTVVLWHEARTHLETIQLLETTGFATKPQVVNNHNAKATVVKIPVADVLKAGRGGVTVSVQFKDSLVPGD